MSREMRILEFTIMVLVVLVGVQLFVLSGDTARDFAWTIKPSLTAAFLGANFWASAVMVLHATRARAWSDARLGIYASGLFTILMLVATLIHLDRFHTGSVTGIAWIVVYVVTPVVLAFVLVRQLRVPGADGERRAPMSVWPRAVIGAQGAVMLIIGIALYTAQTDAQGLWPWPLTPLTAQAVGAWLIGFGVAAAIALREADWLRTRGATAAYAAISLLQLIALARYTETVNFDQAGIWIYVAFLLSTGLIGGYGLRAAVRARSAGRRSAEAPGAEAR